MTFKNIFRDCILYQSNDYPHPYFTTLNGLWYFLVTKRKLEAQRDSAIQNHRVSVESKVPIWTCIIPDPCSFCFNPLPLKDDTVCHQRAHSLGLCTLNKAERKGYNVLVYTDNTVICFLCNKTKWMFLKGKCKYHKTGKG